MAKAKKISIVNSPKKIVKKNSDKKAVELTLDLREKDMVGNILEEPEEKILDVRKEKESVSNIETLVAGKNDFFSTRKAIYLQIHAGNIYSIFGSGLILPSKYVRNRAFSDPQSFEQEYLVLSNGRLSIDNLSLILLELNMAVWDDSKFKTSGSVAFFDMPIPASRIKAIYVGNERIKKDIVTTALINDGGIIPEDLVIPRMPENIAHVEFKKPDFLNTSTDYSKEINQYDKILGTFAFLKNYSVLFSNKTNSIANYPDHYFFALQAVNDSLLFKIVSNEKATLFYQQLFMLQNGIDSASLKWIFERVNSDKNFNDEDVKDFGSIFLNSPSSKDFFIESKDILNNLTKSLERKNAIRTILQLQGAEKFSLYLFAFLRTYGNANTEDKTISRIDTQEYLSTQYGEFVFAVLGYFYGYNNLRNYDEKNSVSDKVMAEVVPLSQRLAIKFELTTLFDYIVLESVYSNVFLKIGGKVKTAFLESASIKKEWPKKEVHQASENYSVKTDDVFGKQVYRVSKKLISDESMKKINKLPSQIPVISDLGVYCFRNKIVRNYSTIGELLFKEDRIRFVIYFKKEDILDAINSNRVNLQELIQRIDLSIIAKELS